MRKTKIVPTLEGINPEWITRLQPLEAGKRYKISWMDCCTEGHFYGTFKGWRLVPNTVDSEPDYPDRAVFEEGHEIEGFLAEEA